MATLTHNTFVLVGLEPVPTQINVTTEPGSGFQIRGVSEATARELRVRVQSSLMTVIAATGNPFRHRNGQHVRVDVVIEDRPASLTSHLDLPIALLVLAALGHLPADKLDGLYFGELALNGDLRPFRGVLPLIRGANRDVVVPEDSLREAAFAATTTLVYATKNIREVCDALRGWLPLTRSAPTLPLDITGPKSWETNQLRLPPEIIRAAAVAAAGRHNILLSGPPGSGKTLIAGFVRDLLPVLTGDAFWETASLYSVAGLDVSPAPPFRAPHHSVSEAGLLGGGERPRPGEVSLAHNGILFLDELPEFRTSTLEALHPALTEGQVRIVRSRASVLFPARPLLVAATNPCPCGYLGHPKRRCACDPKAIARYQTRIPRDLFDIRIDVRTPSIEELNGPAVDFAPLREKVREAQEHILRSNLATGNAQILRVLRLAHTIAKLDGCDKVQDEHMLEAWKLHEGAEPQNGVRKQLLGELRGETA